MSVSEIFESMEYGPALESAGQAHAWITANAPFGHFINGKMTAHSDGFASNNPATGEELAQLSQASADDVNTAVKSARTAFKSWSKTTGHERAKVLYALARLMQKHSRLFAVLETMDNGKPIRESRDIDIPLVARHFYYHAGMAQLMAAELPDRAPLGVCGQIIPWNFPMLMLAWKIAPALAMGNTVVLKPAEFTSLTALLFAQICNEAGVPKGVVNIVTGDGAVGEIITAHKDIEKIAFTGSTDVGRAIRKATAGSGKSLTLELGGKSPYIVFDDADIDSAIEGLVDAIWFNQGQVCCAGSRLLVQENIAETFYEKLRTRMDGLRIGDPLDKCIDVGAMVDPVQVARVHAMVQAADGNVYHAGTDCPSEGCFYPPTLITDVETSSPLMQEEIFGPVLVATTFRTPDEAVALANNTRFGLAATVWSENINLALDIAPKLVAGVVWVNATNLFDAAAGFGGTRESGFGREGGWAGLAAYTKPSKIEKTIAAAQPMPAPKDVQPSGLDRTAKFYFGGKQARPDSGYSTPIWSAKGKLIGHVGQGSRKDIRNAVEAATAAKAWAKTSGHLRAQILYYIGENLNARGAEFVDRLMAMTGMNAGHAKAEVAASVESLFTFAAWADKFEGRAAGVPLRGIALAMNEPTGIIGTLCGDQSSLLGVIRPMAANLAMGNRSVMIASGAYPLAATDLYQVLETSDVPAGAVNILCGDHAEMAPHLAAHMGVDAVWNMGDPSLAAAIEVASASNIKRTWNAQSPSDKDMLAQACEVKTVWVPYGE